MDTEERYDMLIEQLVHSHMTTKIFTESHARLIVYLLDITESEFKDEVSNIYDQLEAIERGLTDY